MNVLPLLPVSGGDGKAVAEDLAPARSNPGNKNLGLTTARTLNIGVCRKYLLWMPKAGKPGWAMSLS